MTTSATVMVKLANVVDILAAATLLKKHGVIDEEPAALVRKYVAANPDLANGFDWQPEQNEPSNK